MSHVVDDTTVSQLIECEDSETMMRFYQKWSDSYDADLETMTAAPALLQYGHIAAANATDLTCKIIDVCAGTGLSGVALQKAGFTNIDAIDGSRGMLDKASTKNVYNDLFHEIIGEDRIHSFPEESYDMAVAIGAYLPGHLGSAHLRSMLKAVRRGGIFIASVRERWLQTEWTNELEAEMLRMEAENEWERVAWEKVESSLYGRPAIVYIYRRL